MKQIITVLFVLLQLFAQSQTNQKINGFIYDEYDMPMEGVNVYLDGTNIGTITNAKGEFNLLVSKTDKKIHFSFLGYKHKLLNIKNLKQKEIKIKLKPYENVLEEIIIPSKKPQDILKEVINNTKKTIKKSALYKTYNREILKVDSSYVFFADGIFNYNVMGKRKKIRSKLFIKDNRIIKTDTSDYYNSFMENNPFGYDLRKLIKHSYFDNLYLKHIYKTYYNYDFTFKKKEFSDTLKVNIIEFEPIDSPKGLKFKGSIVYDEKTKLILKINIEKASNLQNDASVIDAPLFSFKIIDYKQTVAFRLINSENYILVYNKEYNQAYIDKILFKKYNHEYSFYQDLITLDYSEGVFKLDKSNKYNEKSILFSQKPKINKVSFWENNSIPISIEQENFEKSIKSN